MSVFEFLQQDAGVSIDDLTGYEYNLMFQMEGCWLQLAQSAMNHCDSGIDGSQ